MTQLPDDIVAMCITYLDYVYDADVLHCVFDTAETVQRVERQWIAATRVERVHVSNSRVETRVNGVLHSLPASGPAVEEWSNMREWYRAGRLHSPGGDRPALVCNEARVWARDGLLHRDDDRPAIVWADGSLDWYRNGVRHRDNRDKPNSRRANGASLWYRDREMHATQITYMLVTLLESPRLWYSELPSHAFRRRTGALHRDGDRPAVVADRGKTRMWLRNDKLHRKKDKPAIEWYDGSREWYLDGVRSRNASKPNVVFANGYGASVRDKPLLADVTICSGTVEHYITNHPDRIAQYRASTEPASQAREAWSPELRDISDWIRGI